MSQLHLVLALLSLCIRLAASQNVILLLNCNNYPGPCNNKCYAIYVAGKPTLLTWDAPDAGTLYDRRREAGTIPNPCCGRIAAPPTCNDPAGNQAPCTAPDEYPYASTWQGGRATGSNILRCTGQDENNLEGSDLGGMITRARNNPGFGGTGGCASQAPCQIQLDVAHYSEVGRYV